MSPKNRSLVLSLLVLTVLWAFAQYLNRSDSPSTVTSESKEEVVQHQGEHTRANRIERHRIEESIGFASHEKLVQHYRKHGHEFGNISMEDYLRQAQHLRDRPAGLALLEYIRDDGVISRFEKETGTFIAFNADRTIRTCFKPNDGEAYFHRQKTRRH